MIMKKKINKEVIEMGFLDKVKNMFTEEVEEEAPIKKEVMQVEIPAPIKEEPKKEVVNHTSVPPCAQRFL